MNLEIVEVCKTSNASSYPECDNFENEDENEELVDPDETADEETEPSPDPDPI